VLRINKPAKAGLRAAYGTCLGFRAGKPLKLQTANKNAAGMQGLYISRAVFILVMFKLKLTQPENIRVALPCIQLVIWWEAPSISTI